MHLYLQLKTKHQKDMLQMGHQDFQWTLKES
jgi:hypothetical protein